MYEIGFLSVYIPTTNGTSTLLSVYKTDDDDEEEEEEEEEEDIS